MSKIPTAEELFQDRIFSEFDAITTELMIEFAKLHVQKALLFASNSAQLEQNGEIYDYFDDPEGDVTVNKESILNSYPLENIK